MEQLQLEPYQTPVNNQLPTIEKKQTGMGHAAIAYNAVADTEKITIGPYPKDNSKHGGSIQIVDKNKNDLHKISISVVEDDNADHIKLGPLAWPSNNKVYHYKITPEHDKNPPPFLRDVQHHDGTMVAMAACNDAKQDQLAHTDNFKILVQLGEEVESLRVLSRQSKSLLHNNLFASLWQASPLPVPNQFHSKRCASCGPKIRAQQNEGQTQKEVQNG